MPDRSGEREIFMHNRLIRAAGAGLVCLALAAPLPVLAIDTGGNDTVTTAPAPKPMAATPVKPKVSGPTLAVARADIAASNWTKAIADLKLLVAASPKSADAWNLLGFSYRSHGDLKLADAAYDTALKLNPKHTGALEYQGILYIKLGQMDEAKSNLSKIKAICGTTCTAYKDLAKALGT